MEYPGYSPQMMGQPAQMGAGGLGHFGAAMGGMGFGGMPYGLRQQHMMMSQQQGAMMAGAAVPNFVGNQAMPMAGAAMMAGSMFAAPLMMGSSNRMMRGAGRALNMADPFSWAMSGARMGGKAGWGMGGRMFGGMIARGGMRAGLGMGMRAGLAGALGATGIGAPLAIGYGAMEAMVATGRQVWQGAQNTMTGHTFMAQHGQSVAPGSQRNAMSHAGGIGRMFRDVSTELGTSVEDVGRLAGQMDQMKLMRTTSSVREFKSRFREVLDAVKEIAQVTQSSVDDALQTFGDLRQQGFYTTADVKSAAAKQAARASTTGIDAGVYGAVGQRGAQVARSMGMRGRFGSEAFQRSVAGVAAGLRNGTMNEETIMEMGGPEAAGMTIATAQMRFMRSPHGKAMMAATRGTGGAPDLSRMGRLLGGGMGMQEMVTTAAGRGLGNLTAAGRREAREAYAPYAGAMMVQSAVQKRRSLGWGVSREGIINSMGVGRDAGALILDQTMQLPAQMAREREAQQANASRAAWAERYERSGVIGQVKGVLRRNLGMPIQDIGSGMYESGARAYARASEGITGYSEYQGGDSALAREGIRTGGFGGLGGGMGQGSGGLLGAGSAAYRLRNSRYNEGNAWVGPDEDSKIQGRYQNAMRGLTTVGDRTYGGTGKGSGRRLTGAQFTEEEEAIYRNEMGAGTMFEGGASSEDERSYNMARKLNRIGKDITYNDWKYAGRMHGGKLSREKKDVIFESLALRLQSEGEENTRKMLTPTEEGLTGVAGLEQERERFASALGKSDLAGTKYEALFSSGWEMGLGAVTPWGGIKAAVGIAGILSEGAPPRTEFRKKLEHSGATRQAFTDVMDAIADGKSTMEIQQIIDRNSDALGEGGLATVQQHAKRARTETGYRSKLKADWEGKNGFRNSLSRYAVADELTKMKEGSSEGRRQILNMISKKGFANKKLAKAAAGLEKQISDLHGAQGEGFIDAADALFREAITSGNEYTAEERNVINQALGGGRGTAIGEQIQGLTQRKKDKRREFLESINEGLDTKWTGGELDSLTKRLGGKPSEDRQKAILEVLQKQLGSIVPGEYQGAAGTTVAGQQLRYVLAQQTMVDSVARLVTQLSEAGVAGMSLPATATEPAGDPPTGN